jgi:hypothetical protein
MRAPSREDARGLDRYGRAVESTARQVGHRMTATVGYLRIDIAGNGSAHGSGSHLRIRGSEAQI